MMRFLAVQHKIEQKVAVVIASRGPHPFFSLASGLLVFSWVYGVCMRLRRILFKRSIISSHRLPCPVISVGNLCLGGTGKTPTVHHLAKLLCDMGYKPAVLSRGYKGIFEKKGAVVSDGRTFLCDARRAGDEPFLLASLLRLVPVVVGKSRVAAGQIALERFQPNVIVLDDGFQHLRLQRDLNLVLLDARNPFGNSLVLPRGNLREPISALSDADAVIMTRCEDVAPLGNFDLANKLSPRPVFRTTHRSVIRGILLAGKRPDAALLVRSNPGDPDRLKGKRLFAFSGLANNEAFSEGLARFGAQLMGKMGFDDHHPYSVHDARRIDRSAHLAGSDFLVTTDKDYVKLPGECRFSLDLIVMGVCIDFGEDQEPWRRFLAERMESITSGKNRFKTNGRL